MIRQFSSARGGAKLVFASGFALIVTVYGGESGKRDEAAAVSYDGRARQIKISAPAEVGESIEFRIETPGLSDLETGAEVNEPGEIYLPPPSGAPAEPAENVFFFNELTHAPGWELVMRFREPRGRWKLNGRFSPLGGEQNTEVAIAVSDLEEGENLLHLTGDSRQAPQLFYRRPFLDGTPPNSLVDVQPFAWSAHVQIWRRRDGKRDCIWDQQVSGDPLPTETTPWPTAWWRERDRLVEAAVAVGENVCRSQVRRPGSRFEGGFNLIYDVSRRSYRAPHWIWSWGPAINLLLELSKFPAAQPNHQAERFRAVALAAGLRSLQFGVTNPLHPAFGISTVRWEASRATPLGWAEYASPTDSLFLAGWGWMSLFTETKDPIFLQRTRQLVTAAERLRKEYEIIPQDWIFERGRWTPHTLDESLFGTIGFQRLHEATADGALVQSGMKFVDSFLRIMARSDGLLARGWMREEKRDIWDPDIKGHAWVMEGYLDAYRLSGDARFLTLAKQLASKVITCQAANGGWTYSFRQPGPDDSIDDKGTAIWAYLLYQLHRRTSDPEHLLAARRALGWCLSHQYRGADLNLDGAIPQINNMAHVRHHPMTVLYTTAFFGLAIVEELALRPPPP